MMASTKPLLHALFFLWLLLVLTSIPNAFGRRDLLQDEPNPEADPNETNTPAPEEEAQETATVETNAASEAEEAEPAENPFQGRTDIEATGACQTEIQALCPGTASGSSALVDCVSNQIKLIKNAAADPASTPVSKECKDEIRSFKVEMYKDISMDTKMATACKDDISKFCDDDFLYPEPGNVLACLRETQQVGKLTDSCNDEVTRAKIDAAHDIVMDPQLNEICGAETKKLCPGVPAGEGAVQDCLRSQRNKLAWDCQAELFRQEVENSDDIRLNVRLFKSCLEDKKRFCPDVVPGDARVKDCLEEHRADLDFSPACKKEFDKMMQRRATDFRLDPSLRKFCKQDISEICYPDAEDISDVANWDSKVIQCLQDYRDELKDPKCRQQVHQLVKRASEDWRFDRPLAEACKSDRESLCKDVPDGNAKVFLCLQEHRDELKEVCKSSVFDLEIRFSEDIDFKFPMRKACEEEIKRFCATVPTGEGDVIKCLEEHMEDADMGKSCSAEMKKDQHRSAQDYRLNFKLSKACFNDVQIHCLHACDEAIEDGKTTCGGLVLKCLTEHMDVLESKSCKDELFYFEKKEVNDITLDVPLQVNCKADVNRFCADVSRDHAKTLGCLRSHRDELEDGCKEEEMRFSIMESSDIRLTPTLMNACGLELQAFCKDVPPNEGQAFKCLQMNLEEIGMGIACKAEVNLQAAHNAEDYRLDFPLKKECENDVNSKCSGVDFQQEGHAKVLKCLVDNFGDLSGSCQIETTYAVRSALFQYRKGAELTEVCDADVARVCGNRTVAPVGGSVIGVYLQCLEDDMVNLGEGCTALVVLVAKEGAHVGGYVDEDKLQETLQRLSELQDVTVGGTRSASSSSSFVLRGWMAFVAIISLAALLIGAGYFVYWKFFDPTKNYTLVLKAGDV